ncbi:MAG: OB-fold domain-containing protein [Candidatus Hadarchaeales archaeon]
MVQTRKMFAYRCKRCGAIYYPKRARCAKCKFRDFDEIELGGSCTVVTYTKLYAIPRGIDRVPLVLGIVEFENGVRAFGQIRAENVEIGMRLRPVWGKLRTSEGREMHGFMFEPDS